MNVDLDLESEEGASCIVSEDASEVVVRLLGKTYDTRSPEVKLHTHTLLLKHGVFINCRSTH